MYLVFTSFVDRIANPPEIKKFQAYASKDAEKAKAANAVFKQVLP